MPDSVGLRYIHRLLGTPTAFVHASQLVAHVQGLAPETSTFAFADEHALNTTAPAYEQQEVLPQDARRRIMVEVDNLREEIATLRSAGDMHGLAEREDQLECIEAHLSRCTFQGRSVRFASQADRDRKSVGMAIRRAIHAISEIHSTLALHLGNSIKTGASCCYRPERPMSWAL